MENDDDKKAPIDAVIDEMALHSSLTHKQLGEAIMGLLDYLEDRTAASLAKYGGNSPIALQHAHEFLVFTEMINFYGSALIAFEDIDEETLPN